MCSVVSRLFGRQRHLKSLGRNGRPLSIVVNVDFYTLKHFKCLPFYVHFQVGSFFFGERKRPFPHPPNVQLSSPFYMVWKYLCNIVFTVGYTQSKHENLRPLRLLLLLSRGRQRASHFRLFQDSCKEAHQPPRLRLLRSLARLLFLLSLCKFPSVDDWRPRLPKRGRTAPRSPSTCSSLHQ